tara:strand:- start:70 stop:267 length:198 start_codon:yes stop_codon:yes gene_type:complete
MENTLEKVLLDLVIVLVEDDKKDPLDPKSPLTEEVAFDLAVEMLQESLNSYTLKGCQDRVGPINY